MDPQAVGSPLISRNVLGWRSLPGKALSTIQTILSPILQLASLAPRNAPVPVPAAARTSRCSRASSPARGIWTGIGAVLVAAAIQAAAWAQAGTAPGGASE